MFDATPLMGGYAAARRFELAAMDPASEQERLLLGVVSRASSTRFGRDHGFASIATVEAYQGRVPVRRYEDFHSDYWRADFPRLIDCSWPGLIPYFALSSGTTSGRSKYIPCSWETLHENRRGAHEIFTHHLWTCPTSRVLGGKCLVLGGSTALEEESTGVYSGDLSGIEACELQWWEQPWVLPSRDLAVIADWEEKIDRLARLAIDDDIRAISGAPNWLLLFFERLLSLKPGDERIARLLPNLELIIHGGISMLPYRDRFRALLEGSHAETRETYVASEGFIAVADRGDGEGLRLFLDGGGFFEFVPTSELGQASPTRHWIGNVETGVEYAILVSTCSGLWSYVLGDTVRFVDLSPPRILITGRTKYVLSAVGEHLIAEEIEDAIRVASAATAAAVSEYCVGCLEPEAPDYRARHLYIVEFRGQIPDPGSTQAFCDRVDAHLQSLNADYASNRAKDFRLRKPEIIAVPPGTFVNWLKRRGRLGGQNKVPRIINDADLFRELETMARQSLVPR